MFVRIPRLCVNRHGNYYFRLHNSKVDARISLRTKNKDEALARLSAIESYLQMPTNDPLAQLIRDGLGIDIDKIAAEIKRNPELRHFYNDLGLPPSILPRFEIGAAVPKTITIGGIRTETSSSTLTPKGAEKAVSVTSSPSRAARCLSELIEAFSSYNSESTTLKLQRDRQRIWTSFIETFGDIPINTITRLQAQNFKEANRHLSKSRQKTLISHMRVLLDYAQEAGEIDSNPFDNLRVVGAANTETPTEVFNTEELRTLFSPSVFPISLRQHVKNAGYFWAPILLATTGARANEVCQLRIKDIKQEDGIYFLDINDEGEGQTVKTSNSRRRVPIHSTVLNLGFIEFVEQMREHHRRVGPDGQLFICMTKSPTSGWSKNLTRNFRDKRINVAFPDGISEGKTLRSLRKTFITKVTGAGASNPIVRTVVGHADDLGVRDVHIRNYNNSHSLQDCKTQVVERLETNFLRDLLAATIGSQ